MKKINWQRVILISLVGAAFCGFLLFNIKQSQSDEISLYQSNTANPTDSAQNQLIKLTAPVANVLIKTPITLTGQAKVSSPERLRARIKDSKGIVMAERYAQTKTAGQMSDFSITLNFARTSSPKGFIEVFLTNPSGPAGNETAKISIPVKFQ